MAIGAVILVFRPRIKDLTGDIAFAEAYLGAGGTWTFFVILGVAFFIGGLMWATGTLQGFLGDTFGSIL